MLAEHHSFFSKSAIRASSIAIWRLIFIIVVSPEMVEFLPPALIPEISERIKTYARQRIDELVHETSFYGVPCEILLEEGEIGETLKEAVAKYNIDVIALGTQSRGACNAGHR